jgi:hypothetical protein
MKNFVFWDGTPCDSCKNRRFGETYRLHHQDDKTWLAVSFAIIYVNIYQMLRTTGYLVFAPRPEL